MRFLPSAPSSPSTTTDQKANPVRFAKSQKEYEPLVRTPFSLLAAPDGSRTLVRLAERCPRWKPPRRTSRSLYFRKGNPRPKLLRRTSRSRNFARLGAPRNGGADVVTYVKPSIAGATTYCAIYACENRGAEKDEMLGAPEQDLLALPNAVPNPSPPRRTLAVQKFRKTRRKGVRGVKA